jgi:hypothetical protein
MPTDLYATDNRVADGRPGEWRGVSGARVDDLLAVDKGAVICGAYRYLLWRRIANERGRMLTFVMLNPSTADDVHDDPTLRRCISFARRWGFASLLVCNLFALRASRPAALREVDDPVGADNDAWLDLAAEAAQTVVAAWGAAPVAERRAAAVLPVLAARHDVLALGVTRTGAPRHPLYVPSSAALLTFRRRESLPQQC